MTEVAQLLHESIRIDTTNGKAPERPLAEWVAARLDEAGIESRILESEPGRASVVARVAGTNRSRAPLLVHGHLDVVPARPEEWAVDPFAGEVVDGYVWGRGAVDMKNMNAAVLTVLRRWAELGRMPDRDLVVAFVADEEAGGLHGSHFLVREHPELLADCTEAIGEVGGFSVTVADRRLYLVQTAEKGLDWLRLRAHGRPGHASMIHDDNAVARLSAAVARIAECTFPQEVRPEVEELVAALGEATGRELDSSSADWLDLLGPVADMVAATLRNTANPTGLTAGYQHNVIPSVAEATVDARFLPGQEESMLSRIADLAGPGVEVIQGVRGDAVETAFDGELVAAMCAALREEDPAAIPVPYILSGGTDAKAFAKLGMRCYGFNPLRLPADLAFPRLFHGVDERVPVESLEFGVRVLDRLLATC